MAKPSGPGDPTRHAHKKADPQQDQEQEEDAGEKESKEPEHATQQNTLGNEALQNQMINTGNPGGGPGGGGGGGLAMRTSQEKEDRAYGGEDDGGDDLPLTLEDLVRSWNPGTNKTQDRAAWLEPMPDDELPPEDPEWVEAIRESAGSFRVQGGFTVDSQLQPSVAVVAASLLDWTRGLRRWTSPDLLTRAVAHVTIPPRSFLQDVDGRILISRARAAAIGSLLLLDGPALSAEPVPSALVAYLGMGLELRGHRRHQEAVRIDPGVEGKQMPKAVTVFQRAFSEPRYQDNAVDPRALPEPARTDLAALVSGLVDLEDPAVYLPALIKAPDPDEEEEDDPLGLDAVLWEFTGAKKDPEAPLYYAAIQAAEKLAAATARTRVHLASTAVAIAQVSRMYSSGAPVRTLLRACEQADGETDRNLRLLVEIARAAQKRSVPPKGLKAGLKRAARALRTSQRAGTSKLVDIVGGVLPGDPVIDPASPPPADPLEHAWLDGNPVHAVDWLGSLEGAESRAALLLTRAAAGDPDMAGLSAGLLALVPEMTRPLRGRMLEIAAAALALRAGDAETAQRIGRDHVELGMERRNGMLLANGVLLGVEGLRVAGDPDAAEKLRFEGGQRAYALGAPGALTLLARYTTENQANPEPLPEPEAHPSIQEEEEAARTDDASEESAAK